MHTRKDNWRERVEAAYENGCTRFDGAINGFGGCPMADDDLVGNMPTEFLLQYMNEKNIDTGLDMQAFEKSMFMASSVYLTKPS